MIRMIVAALLLSAMLASCEETPTSAPYVEAKLYYRHLGDEGKFTAEATLSLLDSLTGQDTLYNSPGGVAFMGSNLKKASRSETEQRYRQTMPATLPAEPRFTLTLPDGSQYSVRGSLHPWDTLIMGPLPTHNFGFTVYPGNERDTLGPNEMLTALFVSDKGAANTGTVPGPSAPKYGYVFPRNSVAGWPLGEGNLSFVRRRVTPINAPGIKGELVEEIYSKAMRSAVVN